MNVRSLVLRIPIYAVKRSEVFISVFDKMKEK